MTIKEPAGYVNQSNSFLCMIYRLVYLVYDVIFNIYRYNLVATKLKTVKL